jgi:sarcosine oxidase subunit beta
MTHTADAIIIGGGIVGAATAYELASAGLKVSVLERNAVNREGSGTTAGNVHIQAIHKRRPGQLVEADNARFLPLQKAASRLWDDVEDQLGCSVELRRTGGFMVAETDTEVEELRDKFRLEQQNSIRSQLLSGDEARREEPMLGPGVQLVDACEEDGYANPLLLTPAYLRAAAGAGASIHAFADVGAIGRAGANYEVRTSQDRWTAPCLINATGPWLARVAELAGIALNMAPVAIQMHATVRTEPFMKRLIEHVGEGLSVKQVTAGNVLIGGGWPAGGLDTDRRSPASIPSMLGNLALAVRVLPVLAQLRILRVWAGPLASTPDELPVIGEVPGFDGFFVVGGTYAFTLAPLWGRVLRCLVLQEDPPVDLSGIGPDRLMFSNRRHEE